MTDIYLTKPFEVNELVMLVSQLKEMQNKKFTVKSDVRAPVLIERKEASQAN